MNLRARPTADEAKTMPGLKPHLRLRRRNIPQTAQYPRRGAAELRGNHYLVTMTAERAPQVLFAPGAAVDVGRVNDRRSSVRVEASTEVVAAQTNG